MKHSILIVDDEKTVRDSLAKYFSSEYIIYTASNGREAIRMIRDISDIEIILSDLEMPFMDGIELLETIQVVNNDIAVIFMSGLPLVMLADIAIRKGAHDYLPKPIDLDNLDITIRNALRNKSRSRRN